MKLRYVFNYGEFAIIKNEIARNIKTSIFCFAIILLRKEEINSEW